MAYIEFCDADQASAFRLNDALTLPAPCLSVCGEFEGETEASFEGFRLTVPPSMPDRVVLRARRVGLKIIARSRLGFLAHKSKIIARKPAHARARRSPVAHGGALKAADDGDGSSDGDGEPPPYPQFSQSRVLEARI
jgi:hypothetical protein